MIGMIILSVIILLLMFVCAIAALGGIVAMWKTADDKYIFWSTLFGFLAVVCFFASQFIIQAIQGGTTHI